MPTYEDAVRALKSPRLSDILCLAEKHVPVAFRGRPWRHAELAHGKGILVSDDALACYLAAYGRMHAVKMYQVLRRCALNDLVPGFEVVDWGCGQGLASLCLIDHLRELGSPLPVRIVLVDASAAALNRAGLHLDAMTGGTVTLERVKAALPNSRNEQAWQSGAIHGGQPLVLHLLSNIFDVPGIDLAALARVIARTGKENFVICAAHYKMRSELEKLCGQFDPALRQDVFTAAQERFGRLPNAYVYGAALKAFRIRQADAPEASSCEEEALRLAA